MSLLNPVIFQTTSLKHKLEAKHRELSDQRIKFETDMANLEAKMASLCGKIESETGEKTAQDRLVQRLREQISALQDNLKEKNVEKRRSEETENHQKVLSEVRQLSDRLEFLTPVRKTQNKEQEEFLQLSAKVIEENLSDLKRKNARLERELMEKKEVLRAKEDELEALKKTMQAAMGDSEQASKYLQDENIKVSRLKICFWVSKKLEKLIFWF